MICTFCKGTGMTPRCPECKRDPTGKLPKKPKSKYCGYCENKGLFPFCPKCSRDINGRLIVKDKSNYLTEDEMRQRFRARYNMDELTRMYRNIVKVDGDPSWPLEQAHYLLRTTHLTTTGCKLTDQAIIDTYGEI